MWQGEGWYRMKHSGEKGVLLSNPPSDNNLCGSGGSGWLKGEHPAQLFESTSVEYCFKQHSGSDCNVKLLGKVTNCGKFYVYYLPDTPGCDHQYCGIENL